MLARLRATIRRLASEHASPHRLFYACVLGGAIGATPLFGLHLPICLALAALLRLNKVAVYGAANISIPPIAPFLGAASIEVGALLLTRHHALVGLSALRGRSPWTLAAGVFGAWMLGAPFVGGAIGAILGAFVSAAARTRARTLREPFTIAANEARARFSFARTSIRQYVRWKLRLDPAWRVIPGALADGIEIVDLGAGLGAVAILLALLGTRRTIHAVEWDGNKAAIARRAAKGLAIEVHEGDVRTFAIPSCDAILLVDVLHYLDEAEQDALLARARASLRPGGSILVRESDAGRGGSSWTRAIERLAIKTGWNRSTSAPRFRSIDALEAELGALGLEVERVPLSGKLHPGNVLVRATAPRKEELSAAAASEGAHA